VDLSLPICFQAYVATVHFLVTEIRHYTTHTALITNIKLNSYRVTKVVRRYLVTTLRHAYPVILVPQP